jgi:hypothetical protein
MPKYEMIYVGNEEDLPKTTSLGWCRVSVGLVKALDEFCQKNGETNRSAVVRMAIRAHIGYNSVEQLLESEKPFMPRQRMEKNNHE